MSDPRPPLRIVDPDAPGAATLVPELAPGRSETSDGGANAQPEAAPQNLEELRAQFPQSSLLLRVAALNTLMRR